MPTPPTGGSRHVPVPVIVAILVVLGLVAGVAFVVLRPDESSKVAAESPDPRTPEQIWADTTTANAVKLTLADFPAGWHGEPRPDHSGDAAAEKADKKQAIEAFVSCMGAADAALLSGDEESSPGTGKSDTFKADMGSASVEADVTVRSSIDVAKADMALLHKPQLPDCFGDVINSAVRSTVDHPQPGKEIPAGVTFGDAVSTAMDLPGSNADTIGLRVSVPVTGPRGTLTEVFGMVFARKGRTLLFSLLFNVNDPFPTDLAVQLTNVMADRAPDV